MLLTCADLKLNVSSSHQGTQLFLGARALDQETWTRIHYSSHIKNQLSRFSQASLIYILEASEKSGSGTPEIMGADGSLCSGTAV